LQNSAFQMATAVGGAKVQDSERSGFAVTLAASRPTCSVSQIEPQSAAPHFERCR
jgi:hypothetical protein